MQDKQINSQTNRQTYKHTNQNKHKRGSLKLPEAERVTF